jgi:predicted lysophospholipase L1 biosynthesis ABC-type transport system permease subunit
LTDASRGLSELRAQFSLPLQILMLVVALILLIACANVANLMLSRGIARRKELSLKQALGAGRRRLVRQLLTESVLLIALGTAAGLLVGQWISSSLIAAVSSERLPVVMAAGINGRVLLFAAVVLELTVLLCGLAPALSATRMELVNNLNVQEAEWAGSRRSRLGNLLVIGQVALSVIVLVGASLLLHSLVNLETFDVGFDRDHVLLVSMNAHQAARSPNLAAFDEQFLDRVKNLPSVRSASISGFSPISGSEVGVNVAVEGYELRPGETANILFAGVSPGYFRTLGIPLFQGRDSTPSRNHQSHDGSSLFRR